MLHEHAAARVLDWSCKLEGCALKLADALARWRAKVSMSAASKACQQAGAIALQQSCNRAATERWLSTRRTVAFTSHNILRVPLTQPHICSNLLHRFLQSLLCTRRESSVTSRIEGRTRFFSSQSARWLCQTFSKEQYLHW